MLPPVKKAEKPPLGRPSSRHRRLPGECLAEKEKVVEPVDLFDVAAKRGTVRS